MDLENKNQALAEPSPEKAKDAKPKKEKKVKKEKPAKAKKRKAWQPIAAAGALIVAAVAYVAAINIQKDVLDDYERVPVYAASVDIPKGMVIDGDWGNYMVKVDVPVASMPASAITDPAALGELSAVYNIEAGTILGKGMFETYSQLTEGLREPVVAGIKAEDVYQVASGIIRPGDRVAIYTVTQVSVPGGKETVGELKWDNVRVKEVFDLSGRAIASYDTVSSAARLNVYFEHDDVAELYAGLAEGSLRVVKIVE